MGPIAKPEIVLIGGGGHCRACIDVIEQKGEYRIAGIVDQPSRTGERVLGYEILASDVDLPLLAGQYEHFLVTVGQITSPDVRMGLFNTLKGLSVNLPTVVSPLAHVSKNAQVGEGSIVMHFALINAGARVGGNCIINTRATVEHDAVVEDHCHVSTGAIVNGGARIGMSSFLGSGAVCRELVEVGKNSIVGANIFVRRDLPANSRVS